MQSENGIWSERLVSVKTIKSELTDVIIINVEITAALVTRI